jgi:hypothetical protein
MSEKPSVKAPARPNVQVEEIERQISLKQWDTAIALARSAGLAALDQRRPRVALKMGGLLERLDDHVFAARLLAAGGLIESPSPLPEWDGSSLTGRTLLVVQRIRHVGAAIRLARLVPQAAQRAKNTLILAERRLVPLYRRSFPGVDVRESGADDSAAFAAADVVASYETLEQHLLDGDFARRGGLTPLKADAASVDRFRRAYGPSRPLIGFCWHSTNEAKDLPPLEVWAEFMRSIDATYVSIQYGDVRADIEKLRRTSGARLVYDESVDSLENLDLFAAQVAALDAVVTISNTGAHMAGALQVPTHVLLDDKIHLIWPVAKRTTMWYPSVTLVRKEGRDWNVAFDQIRDELLSSASAPSGPR